MNRKKKQNMEIVIESFEENSSEEDSHTYEWFEFKEDNSVPENVINKLRENVMEFNHEIRQDGKIYKYINVQCRAGLNKEQKKEYFLKHLKIGSAEIKQSFVNKLIGETKPIIDVVRNLAISHNPVKWENLPVTGVCDKTYAVTEIKDEGKNSLVDFKITKLWASTSLYGIKGIKEDNSIKLYIITEPPRYRGTIHTHYIGKMFITQNGKKFKKYCDHCENLVFE